MENFSKSGNARDGIWQALQGRNDCLVVAEIAQAHDGSVGLAHSFIDAAADAGVDAVKFQAHIAEAESTLDEPWRVRFSRQDQTRFDYWKRMEFTGPQWRELFAHAQEREIAFLCSPFSVEAVKLLQDLGIKAWKVASGEIGNPELLAAMMDTRLPMIFSSGMSSLSELESAVQNAVKSGIACAVLQCTSEYPCPPEHWGLNLLRAYRDQFPGLPVGFSDHSGVPYAGLAAASLGAEILEVHLTFHRKMFGIDVPASLTCGELATLVKGVRAISSALRNPVEKSSLNPGADAMRKIFGRSLALKNPLSAGTVLGRHHLGLKKPGGGISFEQLSKVVGRKLRKDTAENRLLREEDLE